MSWTIRTLLTVSVIAFPLYLYIVLRSAAAVGLLRPARKRIARKAALLLIACLYSFPVFTGALYLTGRSAYMAQLMDMGKMIDYLFFYPLCISFIIVLELTAPFLLLDIANLAGRFVSHHRQRWRTALAYGRLVLAAVAIVYVPVRILNDTTRVQDNAVEVRVRDLPAELADFRITLVGDIQVDRFTGDSMVSRVHAIVHDRNPHLLLSSGDIVTSGTDYLDEAEKAMCGMKGSLASIGVMGDHDYWSAPREIRSLQVNCGWAFLDNEHRIVIWRGKRILITGLTHIYSQRLDEKKLGSILDQAPRADARILLVHQPAEWIIRLASERGYDIVLAGHTHGGQIVLHPLGVPLTASMRETRFYSGAYTLGAMAIVVTRGVGLSIVPVRYHAPAEVTTIVLQEE